MCFEVDQFVRVHPEVRVHPAQQVLLRLRVGQGQAQRAAVAVAGTAQDHTVHAVAVGQCVGEALEQHHAAALRADEPVGVRGERGALATFGEHRRL